MAVCGCGAVGCGQPYKGLRLGPTGMEVGHAYQVGGEGVIKGVAKGVALGVPSGWGFGRLFTVPLGCIC